VQPEVDHGEATVLSEHLRRVREMRRWEISELSRRSRVPANIILLTESGEHIPSHANTVRLALALRMDVPRLLRVRDSAFSN
jgi:transcriptional regulator with XRE-family HTH domain